MKLIRILTDVDCPTNQIRVQRLERLPKQYDTQQPLVCSPGADATAHDLLYRKPAAVLERVVGTLLFCVEQLEADDFEGVNDATNLLIPAAQLRALKAKLHSQMQHSQAAFTSPRSTGDVQTRD